MPIGIRSRVGSLIKTGKILLKVRVILWNWRYKQTENFMNLI